MSGTMPPMKSKRGISIDRSNGQDYTAKVWYKVLPDRRIEISRIELLEPASGGCAAG